MLKIEKLAFLDWEEVSLEVTAGETVCVVGTSGSGKSLLLRSIADLIPHTGTAFLEGKDCNDFLPTEWRRQVCYQSAEALWWEDSVGAHFLTRPDAASLDRLGLTSECLDWEVARLSMGERQRLGLLRMLNREPRVLLLDEPTSNLDDRSAAVVESLILEYVERSRACSIWVTHSESQAKRIGSRVYLMDAKRLREVGDD